MRMFALFLRQLRQLGLIPGVEQATCPPPPPAAYAAQPPRSSAPLAAKTSQAVPFDPAQYWRRPVTTVTAAHPGPCGACACARAAECPPSQPRNIGIRPVTTENPVSARVQEDYPIPAPRITSVPHIPRPEPTVCSFAEYASPPRLEVTPPRTLSIIKFRSPPFKVGTDTWSVYEEGLVSTMEIAGIIDAVDKKRALSVILDSSMRESLAAGLSLRRIMNPSVTFADCLAHFRRRFDSDYTHLMAAHDFLHCVQGNSPLEECFEQLLRLAAKADFGPA